MLFWKILHVINLFFSYVTTYRLIFPIIFTWLRFHQVFQNSIFVLKCAKIASSSAQTAFWNELYLKYMQKFNLVNFSWISNEFLPFPVSLWMPSHPHQISLKGIVPKTPGDSPTTPVTPWITRLILTYFYKMKLIKIRR